MKITIEVDALSSECNNCDHRAADKSYCFYCRIFRDELRFVDYPKNADRTLRLSQCLAAEQQSRQLEGGI